VPIAPEPMRASTTIFPYPRSICVPGPSVRDRVREGWRLRQCGQTAALSSRVWLH